MSSANTGLYQETWARDSFGVECVKLSVMSSRPRL
jgi:hypothetical protein